MKPANKKKKIDPIDIQLGRLLRIARNASGLSQEQLGTMIGLSFQQIQKYELGFNRVSVSRLLHLAKSLGVSASWFIDKLGNAITNNETSCDLSLELLNKREVQELLHTYTHIENKNDRQCLKRIAALLATQSMERSVPNNIKGSQ